MDGWTTDAYPMARWAKNGHQNYISNLFMIIEHTDLSTEVLYKVKVVLVVITCIIMITIFWIYISHQNLHKSFTQI
jgi:hypothetical protein